MFLQDARVVLQHHCIPTCVRSALFCHCHGGFYYSCFITQDSRNLFLDAFRGSSPHWVQVLAENKPCHGYPEWPYWGPGKQNGGFAFLFREGLGRCKSLYICFIFVFFAWIRRGHPWGCLHRQCRMDASTGNVQPLGTDRCSGNPKMCSPRARIGGQEFLKCAAPEPG